MAHSGMTFKLQELAQRLVQLGGMLVSCQGYQAIRTLICQRSQQHEMTIRAPKPLNHLKPDCTCIERQIIEYLIWFGLGNINCTSLKTYTYFMGLSCILF